MKQRIRVERAIGDGGYGKGWVVLAPTGLALLSGQSWSDSIAFAGRLAANLKAWP